MVPDENAPTKSAPGGACVFCDIVQGKAAASRVYADDLVVAFMDMQPVNRGHLLVVPIAHAAHLAELDARIAAEAPLIPVAELGRVERTILRSALYEVLYSAATPSGDTMRDAVSLARIYAGDAARRLVNGVLGSVSRSGGGAHSSD